MLASLEDSLQLRSPGLLPFALLCAEAQKIVVKGQGTLRGGFLDPGLEWACAKPDGPPSPVGRRLAKAQQGLWEPQRGDERLWTTPGSAKARRRPRIGTWPF